MFSLRTPWVLARIASRRTLATKLEAPIPISSANTSTGEKPKKASTPAAAGPPPAVSSCPPNTILTGLNYLKDQRPVQALADEEYPPWLWTVLEPKVWGPEDGDGSTSEGKAERKRRREENRQRIKDQNFMKTQ